eukprot:353000-Chlamydomonas_euryale.AAC.27
MSSRNAITDRFHRALYAVLLSDGPTTSSKAPMFLGLVFKAMKADVSTKRVAAMAKRLLQMAHNAAPNYACAVLFMLSEVLKAHPALWAGILQPEDAGGDAVEQFGDADADDDSSAHPGDGSGGSAEDDDVERFVDAVDEDGGGSDADGRSSGGAGDEDDGPGEMQLDGGPGGAVKRADVCASSGGGAPRSDVGVSAHATSEVPLQWPVDGAYDMGKREPLYCAAERACWWELTSLASHAHPSVSAMARTLMGGQPVLYDGDPLKDHTLSAFLDKFLAKKPKAHARGSSLMQPLAAPHAAAGGTLADVSSGAFAALAESAVDPADLFLHRFYNLGSVKARAEKRAEAKARKAAAGDDDEDSDGGGASDADADEIDKLLEGEEKAQDDDLGDPDIGGYSYADLARAMQDDEHLEEGGGDDDEGGANSPGGDGDGDDAAEAGRGDDEDGVSSEDGGGGGDALGDALDALSSDDGSDIDGDFELAPGAAEYLQAARAASVSPRRKKGIATKLPVVPRGRDSAAEEPDSEELEQAGMSLFDLPSADTSSAEEGDGSSDGGSADEAVDSVDDAADGHDSADEELAGLMAGSSSGGDDSEEAAEDPTSRTGRKQTGIPNGSKGQKRRKKSADIFASADDYSDFFAQHMESLNAQHAGMDSGSRTPAAKRRRGASKPRGMHTT